jgi:hypothetical protein
MRRGAGPAVAYFAKAPRPGLVKTRLCPPLTPAEAAGLYRGFLEDLLRPVPGARTLVYGWPPDGLGELRALAAAGIEVRPQRGEDLWQRLLSCFRELGDEGHAPVVVRNTDSPDLPAGIVAEAIARCGRSRVVLGPDLGGGYYLIGLAAPCPGLFAGFDAPPRRVLDATVSRARGLGLAVDLLPPHRDVDRFDDLLELWRGRSTDGGR